VTARYRVLHMPYQKLKLLESCYYAQKMKIINKLNLWSRYYYEYYQALHI